MKQKTGSWIVALLLVLCMVAMLPCAALAAEHDEGTYAWTLSDGTLTISGTSMPDWDTGSPPWDGCDIINVVIEPGMTNIGSFSFMDCYDLTSITIPDSVTRIGKNAFMNCRSLTSINIPSGVTSIEEATFYRCFKLSSVTIPDGVTSIGSIAFKYCDFPSLAIPASVTSISPDALSGCMRMTEIVVAEDNPNYCSIDGIVYNKSVTEIVAVPSGMADGIVIPDSVTEIWEAAFAHNYNLTSITIPASVTKIGPYVFSDCPNIQKITFEGDAPEFGEEDPFEGHLSYTEAYYPAGNPTWTEEKMQACGNMLTWIPYEKTSEGGGETEPTPTEPAPTEPMPTEPTDNPKTGDMSLVLPSVLLLLTAAAAASYCLSRKKHIS